MAVIDLDSHLREGYFLDEIYQLKEPYAKHTPVRIADGKPEERRFRHSLEPRNPKSRAAYNHNYMYDPKRNWRGGEIAARQVGGWDMERRLDDTNREGIDHQMIFPTGITIAACNYGGLGAAVARCYNDWVAGLVHGYEERFWPVGVVPAGCPDQMGPELRRCVTELGFRASHLVSYIGPRNVDDPSFFPLYEVAEELDVPLFCHPNGGGGDLTDRFDSFFPMHVLGRPMHCTPALIALVCGGVFERFPKLKVVFFECSAEWPLYWMHRMDDDYDWMKDESAKHLTMEPSEYVKRNCYVTCEADEKLLGVSLAEFPEDHVLMASDYPHFDSEYPHTVAKIRGRTDITERQKEMILGENAARLLNL